MLAAKVNIIRPVGAEEGPQAGFGLGLGVAELLGIGKDFRGCTAVGHTPSRPPPKSKSGILGEEKRQNRF